MTRIFVAGKTGQVAQSLKEAAVARGGALKTAGRPDFDLTQPDSMRIAIKDYVPTTIVNAAAYTAVDAAEDDEATATAINADGAAALAAIALEMNVPFIHISTDYVFDGNKTTPYTEEDATGPTGAYGRSKLLGEQMVMQANPSAIIVRTAWVYSPFGKNFLKTMLSLATRDSLGVVSDQVGNPSYAPDIADAIMEIAAKIGASDNHAAYAGIYHLAGTGSASWHDFAQAIFAEGTRKDLPIPLVNAITTADYPTPAKRPANSRLDCSKLQRVFGIQLPEWHNSTAICVKRLSEMGALG